MKLFLTTFIFIVSLSLSAQTDYSAIILEQELSDIDYYSLVGNTIIKENKLLFTGQENGQTNLYGYDLENNTIALGLENSPWHSNFPMRTIHEVNGVKVMYVSGKSGNLFKFTKDSLVYASPYFSPNNPLGYYIKIVNPDAMIVYEGKLYFQGFIHQSSHLNPCAGEASLMTWDGVNAPKTLPPAYFGKSNCYKSGNEYDTNPRFKIYMSTIFHDTLFYEGARSFNGSDFYYLDTNDSSKVAVRKGTAPTDLDNIMERYVVGENMYFYGTQNNAEKGLFKYKGINTPPEKINIDLGTPLNYLRSSFFGDNLFLITDNRANIIYPDGNIVEVPNVNSMISDSNYVFLNSYLYGWKYLPINNLLTTPLPAEALNKLTYNKTVGDIFSTEGQDREISSLSILGVDGEWILFKRSTSSSQNCKWVSSGSGSTVVCDSVLVTDNFVLFGPTGQSPVKSEDPFFDNCGITYTMDVAHIGDCSANDFPEDSRTTGEIELIITGGETNYQVTWYKSQNKTNWTKISTTNVNKTQLYNSLTIGFYKAKITTQEGCFIETAYYEIKSLKGVNQDVKNYGHFYSLYSYGELPVKTTYITPSDTTKSSLDFEFINYQTNSIGGMEGEYILIHTDQSGCRNIDTFIVGVTEDGIQFEDFCDSTRIYFHVVRGTPPFEVTITQNSPYKTEKSLLTYTDYFHFNKVIHAATSSSTRIVVKDAKGIESFGRSSNSLPRVKVNDIRLPNCQGIYGSTGEISLYIMDESKSSYMYYWKHNGNYSDSIDYSFPNSSAVTKKVSDYGDYYFFIENKKTGCLYKDTISVNNPYGPYQPDLDSIYEICGNTTFKITSSDKLMFSNSSKMENNWFTDSFYFFDPIAMIDPTVVIDTIIYYAPFDPTTGCYEATLDSFTIKSFNNHPIITSDTIMCQIGDRISFVSHYKETDWYVDAKKILQFTGDTFNLVTYNQAHTIYAVYNSNTTSCSTPFDSIFVEYRKLDSLHLSHNYPTDSIITCGEIQLQAENKDLDAIVYWVFQSDTIWGVSLTYTVLDTYKGNVYVGQQLGSCKSAVSNRIFINKYILPQPELLVFGDSLFTNVSYKKITWYRNGVGLTHNQSSFIPEKEGYYQISIEDENGCLALSDSVLFEKKQSTCNCIYPNPSVSKLIFAYTNFEKVIIYNSIGQEIGSFDSTEVDISTLPADLYLCKVFLIDGTINYKKVIKL